MPNNTSNINKRYRVIYVLINNGQLMTMIKTNQGVNTPCDNLSHSYITKRGKRINIIN